MKAKLKENSEMDIELITPEKAQIYLKGNSENRPIKETVVARYAHSMREKQWQLNGEKNYSSLSTALLLLICEEHLGGINNSYASGKMTALVTIHDKLECLKRHPKLRDSCSFISGKNIGRVLGVGLASYLHYRFASLNLEQADEFFMQLQKGVGLGEGNPVLALRNKIGFIKNRGGKKQRVEMMALAIKAWNLFRAKKPAHALRWQEGEDFPIIK